MGKPYRSELNQLPKTLEWASRANLDVSRRVVSSSRSRPLIAIGSGGSLSTAHVMAAAHRRFAGQSASVLTPLEATEAPLDPGVSVVLFSGGGSNVDILAAFSALVRCEPEQLVVVCGKRQSRLANLAQKHQFVDVVDAEGPAGKDGFLATNSLIAAAALICRAYRDVYGAELSVPPLRDAAAEDSPDLLRKKRAAQRLWARDTLVLLYGPASHAAAVDLESKFTEAALGHAQIADYRNFAHGRHHWLAKHGSNSAILAFSDDSDRALASKTLSLVPKNIPVARFDFSGDFLQVMMASLLTTLHIAGWAGEARAIDPGRPGVPEFGRRLFRLSVRRSRSSASNGGTSPTDAAAIERKTGVPMRSLKNRGDLPFWQQALATFKQHLADARFSAVVFDYDGTLVDSRERFAPPREEIARELRRLLRGGLLVGIATGRGTSVRRDLQSCIPKGLWSRMIVGYYNGAEIASLDHDDCPDRTKVVSAELEGLTDALTTHPELRCVATISPRRWQITVEPKTWAPENRLWDVVNQIVQIHGPDGVSVVRSSHSVDVLAPGVSKASVLRRVLEACSGKTDQAILKVGDRGRWPGNDFVLLREPHSISVEEVSVDPDTCWNLAPPGHRGLQVALSYCRSLQGTPGSGGWRFVVSRSARP